jgi:hypothetical protein
MRLFFILFPVCCIGACVGDSTVAPPQDSGAPDTSLPQEAGVDSSPIDAALVCEAGTADCNSTIPGCETSLLTSDTNCGACGHDCGGVGLCTAGVCQPLAIATAVSSPITLSVSGPSVFWVVDTEVQRCPITGCTTKYPGDVGDGVHVPKYSQTGPYYIDTDTTNVWWPGYTTDYTQQSIFYCAVAGCGGNPPSAVAGVSGDNYSTQMTGNTANLYWVNGNNGTVTRVRKSDKTSLNLPIPYLTSLANIAADDNHVLITDSSAPVNGGGLYVCSDASTDCAGKFALLLDTAQYVTTNGTLAVVNQPSSGAIVTCDLSAGCSGSGTVLTMGEMNVSAITADANAVYWAIGTGGTIRTCPLPSCAGGPQTLASAQLTPRSIVNDPSFVYWANQGTTTANTGSIMRVAKPM